MSTHPQEESFSYAANVAAQLLLSDDYITVPLPLANLLGLEKAVLLKIVDAWCVSNQKRQSQSHFKHGHFWTYGSYEDWAQKFPFLGSPRHLQRLFLSLEKDELLLSEMLSDNKCDRRKWYRVNRDQLGLLHLSALPQLQTSERVTGYSVPGNEQKYTVPKGDDHHPELARTSKCIVPEGDDGSAKSGLTNVPKGDDDSARSGRSNTKTYYNDLTQRLNSTHPPFPPTEEQQAGVLQPEVLLDEVEGEHCSSCPPEPQQPQFSLLGEKATNHPGDEAFAPPASHKSSNTGLPTQTTPSVAQTSGLSEQATVYSLQYSPVSSANRFSCNQAQLPKNINGSDHLPWDTNKRGVFDPEFEKWMARSLMQYPAYQNLMAGELLTKVRKHISASRYDLKRRDELLIEWEAMLDHKANDFSTPCSTLTAKGAARRAKIARALSMEAL